MVRKSNYNHNSDLLATLGDAAQAYQDATDEVDEAASTVLGVNRTDLRCLSVLWRGPMIASELAKAAGLTRGAMTTVLDRLEHRAYAQRAWDQDDRRSVRIELTKAGRQRLEVVYGPLGKEGFRMLQKYQRTELVAVLRYLEEGRALQRHQAERIRRLATPAKSG
jgi:DNA-binding MarR family transcriptional regulator